MIRLSEGREFRYSVITRNKARGSFLNEADDRGEDSVSINAVRCNSGSSSAIPTSGALSFSHESDPSSLSPISTARISRLLMPGGQGDSVLSFFIKIFSCFGMVLGEVGTVCMYPAECTTVCLPG
jgi:hypothetical protein